MADRINPVRKNRLLPKEIGKRTIALTLLLSTIACSKYDMDDSIICWGPLLFILGPSIVGSIIGGIIEKIYDANSPSNDSVGDAPNGPSYVGGGDPDHKQ